MERNTYLGQINVFVQFMRMKLVVVVYDVVKDKNLSSVVYDLNSIQLWYNRLSRVEQKKSH